MDLYNIDIEDVRLLIRILKSDLHTTISEPPVFEAELATVFSAEQRAHLDRVRALKDRLEDELLHATQGR